MRECMSIRVYGIERIEWCRPHNHCPELDDFFFVFLLRLMLTLNPKSHPSALQPGISIPGCFCRREVPQRMTINAVKASFWEGGQFTAPFKWAYQTAWHVLPSPPHTQVTIQTFINSINNFPISSCHLHMQSPSPVFYQFNQTFPYHAITIKIK